MLIFAGRCSRKSLNSMRGDLIVKEARCSGIEACSLSLLSRVALTVHERNARSSPEYTLSMERGRNLEPRKVLAPPKWNLYQRRIASQRHRQR